MARKTSETEIPDTGGSYVRRKDGSLEVAHATEQAPAVHEHDGDTAPVPAGEQAQSLATTEEI